MKKKEIPNDVRLQWRSIWGLVEAGATGGASTVASRNETTYGNIKRMILAGQLGPGRKLVHEEMAGILKVSRTPVREALERLYQEGFVTRLPRRGFYVAEITRDEAVDLYGTREALEIHALSTTLERGPLTRSAISSLKEHARKYEQFTRTQVLTERILADIFFHLKLAELSGNRFSVRILAQTFERLALKRRLEGYRYDRSQAAVLEHENLIDALSRNEKKLAIDLLRKHIRSARDALLSQLYELPVISFDAV
jgi:GntR family transcriptional regulator, rspAB operon transcriptional repressor